MSQTPLLDALRNFAGQAPLRMHMPGHKGLPLPVRELAAVSPLDVTELSATGNLFDGDGPIAAAEALWAADFHMPHCLFLTGGSTQGIHTALAMTCSPGDTVLLDRASHRAIHHALALLDLTPAYLERPWLPGPAVAGPISPASLAQHLADHPKVKTFCITSPTYYGILSDIPALAALMHQVGGYLVVDAAHGAHLPFLGYDLLSSADVVVTSAHKTLPALGQSALLFASAAFSHADMRRWASVFGSSSPSYPMMAALDGCRAYLEGDGRAAYRFCADQVRRLRTAYPAVTDSDAPLDPTRLVLRCPDGFAVQDALEAQGVYCEMADCGHLVCILTCADDLSQIRRLRALLDTQPLGAAACPAPPPLPEIVMSPRTAMFSPREQVPLSAAVGRVAAQQLAPYPPGIPIVAPGERVEKKTVAYLMQIGYNIIGSIEVVR